MTVFQTKKSKWNTSDRHFQRCCKQKFLGEDPQTPRDMGLSPGKKSRYPPGQRLATGLQSQVAPYVSNKWHHMGLRVRDRVTLPQRVFLVPQVMVRIRDRDCPSFKKTLICKSGVALNTISSPCISIFNSVNYYRAETAHFLSTPTALSNVR